MTPKEKEHKHIKYMRPIREGHKRVFKLVLDGASYENIAYNYDFDVSPNRIGQITRNTASKIREAMLIHGDTEPIPQFDVCTVKALRLGKDFWLRKLGEYYEK